ncbi:MAG TPA: DMT family transporter [Candidatus Kapabacteria bacterium]|nr:DMT family transporter [Candidatus Kapabacteria bacterium]
MALYSIPIIWGTTFAIVQRALVDATPMAFVVVRLALISVAFVIFSRSARMGTTLLFRAKTSAERLFRRDILVLGVSFGLGYFLQTAGLLTTTTSKSAFLTSTAVVWTPIISYLVGREKITGKLAAAVIVTLAGVFFMTQPYHANGITVGDLLTLGCAIMFGVYIVWIDRAVLHAKAVTGSEHAATMMITSTQMVAASLLLVIFLPVVEVPRIVLTPYCIGALLFTALIGTGATAYLQARYQNIVSPATAAVIYMIEPVTAMLIAELFLTEQIGFLELLGGLLIITGVIIAQAKKRMKVEG